LDNAIRYSPSGSEIELSATKKNGNVLIEVADRGPGLSDDELTHVFDKFYRAPSHRSKGGVGLGLTVCRGIVQAHGGRIWAQNRPGGGAVFQFTLPIGQPPVIIPTIRRSP
jgi:two-component system sensor histidine kinase KdpD